MRCRSTLSTIIGSDVRGVGNRKQGYIPQLQEACYAVGARGVARGDAGYGALAPEAIERTYAMDWSLMYLAFSMFSAMYSMVEDSPR